MCVCMVDGAYNPNQYANQINEIKKWALNLGGLYLLWFVYFDTMRFTGDASSQALFARLVYQALPIGTLIVLFHLKKTRPISQNTFDLLAFATIISVGFGHCQLILIAHDSALFFPRIGLTIILIYSGLLLTLPIVLAILSSLIIISLSAFAYIQTDLAFEEVLSIATFYAIFASCCVFTNYVFTNILWSNSKLIKVINHQANSDDLTQLSNRRHFFSQAKNAIEYAADHNQSLSLLVFDLDNFKAINDRLGHYQGDLVLVKMAKLIHRHAQGRNDLVARLGGDEFVMLLSDRSRAEVESVCNHIIAQSNAIFQSINCTDQPGDLGISIGVYRGAAKKITSLKSMMQQADAAMYRAKQSGKNQFQIV